MHSVPAFALRDLFGKLAFESAMSSQQSRPGPVSKGPVATAIKSPALACVPPPPLASKGESSSEITKFARALYQVFRLDEVEVLKRVLQRPDSIVQPSPESKIPGGFLYDAIKSKAWKCALLLSEQTECLQVLDYGSLCHVLASSLGSPNSENYQPIIALLEKAHALGKHDDAAVRVLLEESIRQAQPRVVDWILEHSSDALLIEESARLGVLCSLYKGAERAQYFESTGRGYPGFFAVADKLASHGIVMEPVGHPETWSLKRMVCAGFFALARQEWQRSAPDLILPPSTAADFCDWVRISQRREGLEWLGEQGVSDSAIAEVAHAISSSEMLEESGAAVANSHRPSGYGGEAVQAEYRRWFRRNVKIVAQQIRAGVPFWEIAEGLAVSRQEIAFRLDHFPAEKFGAWRSEVGSVMHTPLGGYPQSYERALELLRNRRVGRGNYTFHYRAPGTCRVFSLTTIENEMVIVAPVLRWLHTGQNYLEDLKPLVDDLFNKARSTAEAGGSEQSPIDTVCNAVARWHWLFAHMCPYKRGSAAMGEVLIAALLDAHGIEAGESTVAEGRDTLALTTLLENYVQEFNSTFTFLNVRNPLAL